MVYETLTFQKEEKIGIISIREPTEVEVPGKTSQLSDELNELSAEIAWDDETQVVVLTGAGEGSFSFEPGLTGSLLKEDEGEQIRFRSMAEPISMIDRPVIAAINGDALGQGLEMVLACDIRIAVGGSHFGLPQVKSGLIPWDGGTQRLSRVVGSAKALEMILTGERIDVREAFRMGLINKIVSPGDLRSAALEMARQMAMKGPIALKYAKEAVHKGLDLTLDQGLRLEADLYLLIHTTGDRTEGIKAFREKKVPKFEGR